MKKSVEIIGLPLISIQDGQKVGTVKTLIINPDEKSIDFLTVQNENWQVTMKAVPFKKIIGVGDYAVTIEQENNIIDITEIPIANTLVNRNIKMIGNKVMTRKGELLDEVVEFYVDDETGKISAIELDNAENTVLPFEYVVTIGKEMIIVHEDWKNHLTSEPEAPQQSNNEVEPVQVEEAEDHDLVKQKQMDLLKGKKATESIYGSDGELLVNEGEILTEELIETVQENSQAAFIQLSISVE
ncbi:hypothetical protein JCM9140_3468 [Halalkalibacter wakoensis JCM 9140]|uniref:PRC-barrel domain-containing protein n=1 Tax=Halalkalibacter wakoensis JCM 9140 TaxID=1236970 RepID=W4Q7H5_9BACI|nr:PRC-barrel domain-containing protein [Halalkalibacter wakoensis]GAE27334.1 hypothetical protein JCM9140_3468 [Halalkalibacter wakoensis JCM 9140]